MICMVNFNKGFSLNVEGQSLEEVKSAVEDMSDNDIREKCEMDASWHITVSPLCPHFVPLVKEGDFGVLDGELVCIEDYQAAHPADAEAPKEDTLSLWLPGMEPEKAKKGRRP